ncbi:MAG: LysE family transporter [Nitratireductor sp.]
MVELLTVITFTIMVAIVPGPDFLVVTRNAISAGRLAGIMTSLGIALALAVHITYALAGIGLIISQSIFLFNAIKLVGAAYLIFLGITMYRSANEKIDAPEVKSIMSPWRALSWGFITNVTNPKATMFVLSLFVQVTSPTTPLWTQIGYGLIMAGGVFLWFVFVSFFLTIAPIRAKFLKLKTHLDRSFGVLFTLFGIGIALTTSSSKP